MRRVNSVCFVQSRFTLWDSVFSFNGSSDVTRGKERGSVTDSSVVVSIFVIWRESSGS